MLFIVGKIFKEYLMYVILCRVKEFISYFILIFARKNPYYYYIEEEYENKPKLYKNLESLKAICS